MDSIAAAVRADFRKEADAERCMDRPTKAIHEQRPGKGAAHPQISWEMERSGQCTPAVGEMRM